MFEEYVERAWDLYFGREGQESLQATTPLHLRAQLSSTAYEAVRKLDHSKLRTTTSEGKPTQEGMKLFLRTLKEAIAQEAPVRVNELFLQYFYSPSVWRKPQESMGQYIIRREADFTRLKEASSETELSDNLKCMLLLIFSGIDNKEQQNILASVNSEYNYKKVSHALRIQFPTTMNRPVLRKDYLGAGRSSNTASHIAVLDGKGLPKEDKSFWLMRLKRSMTRTMTTRPSMRTRRLVTMRTMLLKKTAAKMRLWTPSSVRCPML